MANPHRLIGLLIGCEQLIHARLARAVGSHLPAPAGGFLCDGCEGRGLDEEQSAVIGLGDLIGFADAPGLAHEGSAVEHSTINENLHRTDPDPVVADPSGAVRLARSRIAGQLVEL